MTKIMVYAEYQELPTEVQNKVRSILKAYNEVNIVFENGQYNVSPGISIKAKYAADHKFIGTVNKNQIYTPNEQIENFINSFYDYPIQYKGRKDYRELKEAQANKSQFKLVDGNLVVVK